MKLKKLLALVLATMMVLAMSSVAFAADLGNDTTGVETGVNESNSTSISIKQAVIITNNEGSKNDSPAAGKVIAYPAMSFTYGIAGATIASGTTVSDGNVTVDVKSGPMGVDHDNDASTPTVDGLSVAVTNIDAGTVELNAKGQEVVFATATFSVDLWAYKPTGAGIYRFAITDTSTAASSANLTALQAAGVVRGTSTDDSYFLDVYIANDTAATPAHASGLKVAGYVLTSNNETTINTTTPDPTVKESGFDEVKVITDGSTTKLNPSEVAPLDKNYSYTTYNVTLTKNIEGTMGDKSHGFPFTVTVNNYSTSAKTATQGYDWDVTGSNNAAHDKTLQSQTAVTANLPMSDGSTLKIWGLSPFATVNYAEKNDTSSVYNGKIGNTAKAADVKAEESVDANSAETFTAFTEAKAVAENYTISTTATLTADADEIYFTNTLNDISPTGIVLRFAPYVAMMAGGTALFLVLFLKRRKNEEEEEA